MKPAVIHQLFHQFDAEGRQNACPFFFVYSNIQKDVTLLGSEKNTVQSVLQLDPVLPLLAFEGLGLVSVRPDQSGEERSLSSRPHSRRSMIIGMAVFTVVLLIQSIIKLSSEGWTIRWRRKPETLTPKDKGVLGALITILLCCAYVYFFKSAGYVLVSFVISAVIMWMIGLRKPLPLVLISALVPLGIWLVFYKLWR